jgi:HEAT repeat protein
LIPILDETQPDACREAARTLEAIGPEAKEAIPALKTLLEAKDEYTRNVAASALSKIEPAAAKESLPEKKPAEVPPGCTPKFGPRPATAPDAAILYEDKPAAYWLKKLEDRAPSYRMRAIAALGGIAEKDHALIPTIVDCLADSDFDVHCKAADVLHQLGDAAFPALADGWKDRRPAVAAKCWEYAADHPRKELVPAMIPFLDDPKQDSCWHAVWALGAVGPEARAAVPQLVGLLQEKRADDAALALEKIGPGAREAIPALRTLLQSSEGNTRRAAADALQAIGAEAEKEPPPPSAPTEGAPLPAPVWPAPPPGAPAVPPY